MTNLCYTRQERLNFLQFVESKELFGFDSSLILTNFYSFHPLQVRNQGTDWITLFPTVIVPQVPVNRSCCPCLQSAALLIEALHHENVDQILPGSCVCA